MRSRGFTLIELMVTVFIVSLLTAVATISYTRSSRNSRMSSEVNTVFASFKAKIESRKLEQSLASYKTSLTDPPDSDVDDFWPAAAPDSTADSWSSGLSSTHYWTEAGLSPKLQTIYCRYLLFMGDKPATSTTAWPSGSTRGATIFGSANQPYETWYYLVAQCNLQDQGVSPENPALWQEWNSRFDNSTVWMVEG